MYTKTLGNQKVQFQNGFSEPKPNLFKSGLNIKHGMQNKSKSTCLGRFKFELECEYEIKSIRYFDEQNNKSTFFTQTIRGFEMKMAPNRLDYN